MAEEKKEKSGGGVNLFVGLFILVAISIFMLPVVIVLIGGMVPGILAFMVDPKPEKNTAITVSIMNFCGITPIILTLVSKMTKTGSIQIADAFQLLSNPFNMLTILGAAAFGIVLISVLPPIMAILLSAQNDETLKRLKAKKQRLQEEWGKEIESAAIEVTPEIAHNAEV